MRRGESTRARGLTPALILVSVGFVEGLETNLVAGALPFLQDEFHFGDTLAGAIPTAAAIAGLAASLPGGYLADRYRRTSILGFVVASWALLSTASALAASFWMFFAVRVVLGSANHLYNPAVSSLLTDFYRVSVRSRIFALQRVAQILGVAFGIGIGGLVGEQFGWRAAFVVAVVPGLVVALACWRLREPVRGGLDRVEHDGAQSGREEPAPVTRAAAAEEPARRTGFRADIREDLRSIARIRSARAIYTGVMIAFAGFGAIAFWMPTFWERRFDVGEGTSAALTGALAVIATLAGSVAGGVLGDRWHGTRRGGRVVLAGGSLLFGGILLTASLPLPALELQVPVIVAAACLLVCAMPNFAAALADVLPPRQRGIGFAVFTFVMTLGTAVGPLLIGVISEVTGSLTLAMMLAAAPAIPGALVVLRARHDVDADSERAARTDPAPAGS